jgi:DegV family protein with EDD domain
MKKLETPGRLIMENGIIVDSGCDVNNEHIIGETCTLSFAPLNLQVENKIYIDDETLDLDAYLKHMEAATVGVKTSAPSPGSFVERFGLADNIFTVTLSSKLSATYQSALTAKRMYLDEIGKKFIHVFDSLTASVGEGVIAMKIAELIKKGTSNLDIVEQVNQFMLGMRTYFILDKFDNLVKTGRINPYIAKIASFLSIKPICAAKEGEIKMVDKSRGFPKAMNRLVEIIRTEIPDIHNRVIGITHVQAYEKAVAMKDALLQLRPKEIKIIECNGITTTYANRGGIVLGL